MVRQRMAAVLAAQDADFRLLAEESSNMVMRIGFDENIAYISPSCARVVGWDAQQLTGTPALAGVNGEDLERVRQTVTGLKRGEIEETRIIYRTRHREKGEIWLETALRTPRSRQRHDQRRRGDFARHDGAQGPRAEARRLATLDGLTGLANRRHFDETLREEWARARRDGARCRCC